MNTYLPGGSAKIILKATMYLKLKKTLPYTIK